ncbi:OmpA family protein [Catenovulum sp. 2E275]|uniref:OmpA family protein n=1 Tax=Catenovulum sp. 2E275 TaxID=2980497 RepID=UPI0021D15E2C|nr:OmpA family protein [Catenovulum sp. 2E275]MCU4676476.1 OmpA family protein [Catenovulum sp. 2E275]
MELNKTFKLAALTAAMLSAPAMAEEPVYVTGGANLFLFDTEVHNLDSGFGPWLGLGYQIDDKWAVELDYNMADTDTRGLSPNVSADVSLLSLNGIYRYAPVGQNSLLVKAGLGKYELDAGSRGESTETVLKAGAGYEYFIQPNLSATFMWDLLYSTDESLIDSMPSIGLKYQFGSVKSKPAKVEETKPQVNTLDSDNDGVPNAQDVCANTPAGVRVNSQGCPFDRDADGVYDYLDECPATPAGARIDDKGCRVQLTEKVSIDLYVSFPLNSSYIPDEYNDEIKQVADFMREYPDTNVQLVGYTDSTGTESYNQMLSEKRAAKVGDYLVNKLNIDAARVSTVGKGEANPIASNATKEGRAKNRRVTAEITAIVEK